MREGTERDVDGGFADLAAEIIIDGLRMGIKLAEPSISP